MKYLHSLQSVAGNSGSAVQRFSKASSLFLAARAQILHESDLKHITGSVYKWALSIYSIDAKTRAIKFVVEFGAKYFATQSHGLNIDSRTHLMQFVCVGTTTLLVLLPWSSYTLRCSKGSVNRCNNYNIYWAKILRRIRLKKNLSRLKKWDLIDVSSWCLILQCKVP